MGAAGAQGPPVRNIHIQIPPADLYTFPYRISWENLIKYQSIFPLMVILSILTAFLDRPFHSFFQLLAWTRYRRAINTTEKSSLRLVKLPSLKVIC